MTSQAPRTATVSFERCPVCGSDELKRLPDDWQSDEKAMPIIGCGNPWHYATRSLGDAPEAAVPASPDVTEALRRAWGRAVRAADTETRYWLENIYTEEAAALPADKPEPSVQAEPAGLDVVRRLVEVGPPPDALMDATPQGQELRAWWFRLAEVLHDARILVTAYAEGEQE